MYSNELLFLDKIQLTHFNMSMYYNGFFWGEINYVAYFYVCKEGHEKIESNPLEI